MITNKDEEKFHSSVKSIDSINLLNHTRSTDMLEISNNSNNSNEVKANHQTGRWLLSEHSRFIKGCLMFGNNWKKVKLFLKIR